MGRWIAAAGIIVVALAAPVAMTQWIYNPNMDTGSSLLASMITGLACGTIGGQFAVQIVMRRRP